VTDSAYGLSSLLNLAALIGTFTRAPARAHCQFRRAGLQDEGLYLYLGHSYTVAGSSLSSPRITTPSTSSGNGRCIALASAHGARIQTSDSLSVVWITGISALIYLRSSVQRTAGVLIAAAVPPFF
jgi:hypothetical protein